MREGGFAYGGSTLTQQLVKNNLLSPKKSLTRKFQEAILAVDVETKYSKEQILEMYINSVYFGEGAVGINEASKVYFAKDARDLTLAEASYLAGMLKFPNLVSPYSGDKDLGLSLKDEVLEKMNEYRLIDDSQYMEAKSEKLTFKRSVDMTLNEAPHFALLVIDKLKELYGNDIVYEGLEVKTSLDLDLQQFAQQVVRENVAKNRANGVSNGAVVAMDPKTGEILALVGSYNWFDEKAGRVNMATSPRQPGSSFKPLVYALAFDEGLITPATVLKDSPRTYNLGPYCQPGECTYKPANYDRKFRGAVTVRRALANSLNIPAVDVMQRVGIETLLEKAPDFGITTLRDKQYYGKGLSLVLGSAEVPPLQMAEAYSAFANNGQRPEPQLILKVKDKYGKVLFEESPSFQRVISEESAYLINSILSDNNARSEMFGSLLTTPFPAAVKTGTTDNYRDAWTIGYTPGLVVAVWVGNNDASRIYNLPGSLAAAPIWKEIIRYGASKMAYENFKIPQTIVRAHYCDSTSSGSARFEYFIKGTQPRRDCESRTIPDNITRNDSSLPHIGGSGQDEIIPAGNDDKVTHETEKEEDKQKKDDEKQEKREKED